MSRKLGWLLIGGGLLGLILVLVGASVKAAPTLERFIAYLAQLKNAYLSGEEAQRIASSLVKWTRKRNLNVFSILAITEQESSFNPEARGPDGELGLMQLSDTALQELNTVYEFKVDKSRLFEIDYNLEVGTLFYLHCVRLAKGNRFEAIARYKKTTRWWEATDYAEKVLAKRKNIISLYEKFKKGGI